MLSPQPHDPMLRHHDRAGFAAGLPHAPAPRSGARPFLLPGHHRKRHEQDADREHYLSSIQALGASILSFLRDTERRANDFLVTGKLLPQSYLHDRFYETIEAGVQLTKTMMGEHKLGRAAWQGPDGQIREGLVGDIRYDPSNPDSFRFHLMIATAPETDGARPTMHQVSLGQLQSLGSLAVQPEPHP